MDEAQLTWSAQFTVARTRRPPVSGDKILLPPSALEQLLSASAHLAAENARRDLPAYDPYNSASYSAHRHAESQYRDQRHQLPHPLTFRLVNPRNGRVVYAGVREFSAEEGQAVLSPFLQETLQVGGEGEGEGHEEGAMAVGGESRPVITVHAKQLPRGTFVKLRPLEAGYDAEDWKALLEQHLRQNYTTMTHGEVLVVPGARGIGGTTEEFRFLVDGFKPESDGICIVDTDLEVDIEALNEEQARETLKTIAAKMTRASGSEQGSSPGGELDIFKPQEGRVLPGEYVDYQLSAWDKSQALEIELRGDDDIDGLDLLLNPLSATQRAKPRLDEHVFADFDGRPAKRIRLEKTNVELENVEALYVSVHAFSPSEAQTNGHTNGDEALPSPRHFTLRARHPHPDEKSHEIEDASSEESPNDGDVRCKNCGQWVPERTLMLHENFCLRNSILCPNGCGQVFQKRSPEFDHHWHCPHDSVYGNTALAHQKHDTLNHPPSVLRCAGCGTQETFPSIQSLAQHKTTTCPSKLILCRFCHLVVPQEGDPDNLTPYLEAQLSGLTPHEVADGARTTECHLCNKIVRLRDMDTHLKNHDLDRFSRPPPIPCRNVNCGRTLDTCSKTGDTRAGTRIGQGPGNDIGLCSVCFGPLYVSMYDPDGKALRRRIERRYLQQLVTGCGRPWCRNEYCKTGRTHLDIPGTVTTKDAVPMVKPLLVGLAEGDPATPLHFCVDEKAQKARVLAMMLAAERGVKGEVFDERWCVGALEAVGGDVEGARAWLRNFAPTRGEVRG
ncbi:Amino-terminal Zinc-binding domain of ubiquitin ligase E3A [Teratosphaeria destructans]|uniref:Amino-terminal Zinc-binding domain of ubiquitin ligase E3A n=1 Tax=Teratosphaeria destructans TaxID=418781 RepID=A0A9W7SWK7_9PEZI|nr:Amino-terminal Zinc-binding domain of ubiquitin ligase E3A [Teratosphaeria destructans]